MKPEPIFDGPCLACRGSGCGACEPTGGCPGCGMPLNLRRRRVSAEEAEELRADGLTPLACRHCGKHVRLGAHVLLA